jgi:hemerythrin
MSLTWSQDLETGNEAVDEQHQMLFAYVNDVIDICEDEDEIEKIRETLAFLVHYTVQHFQDEEALQLACGYPDYEEHKRLHEEFKQTALELTQRFTASGSSAELRDDVKNIVVCWLIDHIRGEDKKIGRHIRDSAIAKI